MGRLRLIQNIFYYSLTNAVFICFETLRGELLFDISNSLSNFFIIDQTYFSRRKSVLLNKVVKFRSWLDIPNDAEFSLESGRRGAAQAEAHS